MLRMNEISKVYRTELVETHALRSLDLHVEEGEFVAVTGPSGSGTSSARSSTTTSTSPPRRTRSAPSPSRPRRTPSPSARCGGSSTASSSRPRSSLGPRWRSPATIRSPGDRCRGGVYPLPTTHVDARARGAPRSRATSPDGGAHGRGCCSCCAHCPTPEGCSGARVWLATRPLIEMSGGKPPSYSPQHAFLRSPHRTSLKIKRSAH